MNNSLFNSLREKSIIKPSLRFFSTMGIRQLSRFYIDTKKWHSHQFSFVNSSHMCIDIQGPPHYDTAMGVILLEPSNCKISCVVSDFLNRIGIYDFVLDIHQYAAGPDNHIIHHFDTDIIRIYSKTYTLEVHFPNQNDFILAEMSEYPDLGYAWMKRYD